MWKTIVFIVLGEKGKQPKKEAYCKKKKASSVLKALKLLFYFSGKKE